MIPEKPSDQRANAVRSTSAGLCLSRAARQSPLAARRPPLIGGAGRSLWYAALCLLRVYHSRPLADLSKSIPPDPPHGLLLSQGQFKSEYPGPAGAGGL